MIASFGLLSRPDVEKLNRELTCFLFPVAGLEAHGEHLPLGTKQLIAEEWAQSLAQKLSSSMPQWNFVLMPLLPLTVDTVTTEFALSVRPHVVRDAIVDQCTDLKSRGFLHFLVVSGHATARQLTTIEDACKIVSRKSLFLPGKKAICLSITSTQVDAKEVAASPWIAIPKEHAGAFETGLVLKINSQWVRPGYASLETAAQPKASVSRFFEYFQNKLSGYWGAPARANAQSALQELDAKNAPLAEQIKLALESGRGVGSFYSAYRWFPMNGSYFKAYLLASIFFLVMLLWAAWSWRGVFEP